MLRVKTSQEAETILKEHFAGYTDYEEVSLGSALGRTLFKDVISRENIPDFHRSMVDGYAVRASDTFGCSDSIPALLRLEGEVTMGRPAEMAVGQGLCAYVPTGGQIPQGADASLDSSLINGYAREEFTHTAVAAQIAAGTADAGLGIYSAAKLYGLDFIPICNEEYDLLLRAESLNQPLVQHFLDILRSSEFRRRLETLGGYVLKSPGAVIEF